MSRSSVRPGDAYRKGSSTYVVTDRPTVYFSGGPRVFPTVQVTGQWAGTKFGIEENVLQEFDFAGHIDLEAEGSLA